MSEETQDWTLCHVCRRRVQIPTQPGPPIYIDSGEGAIVVRCRKYSCPLDTRNPTTTATRGRHATDVRYNRRV